MHPGGFWVNPLRAGYYTENRCLSRAVRADQSVAAAGEDLKARVTEQHLRAVLFGNTGKVNHGPASLLKLK